MNEEKKKTRWFYLKKADSYRLLDLFLNVTLIGLSFVITFMVSLGYKVLAVYVPEIKEFPYFIAFLPALASGLTHPVINFICAFYHGTPLVDLVKKEAKKEAFIALVVSLTGTAMTLILFLLFYFKAIPGSEEFLYVLIALPMGIAAPIYLAFVQIKGIIKNEEDKRKRRDKILLIFLAFLPAILGFATYFPTLLGFTYFGISLLPLPYVLGDSLCMDKKESEISEEETE